MSKLVIIALLATATCGFPATDVDDHSAIQRPETTDAEPNYAPPDPGQELESVDFFKPKEDLTPVMARPKRSVCVGLVSVCTEDGSGTQNITSHILDAEQQNMKTVVGGFVDLAKAISAGRNYNQQQSQQRISSQ